MSKKSNTTDEINNNVVYGYARVSTVKQSLTRQITNLTKYDSNIKIYQEKFSGRKIENRQELKKLLSIVRKGDSIVFDSVSRMSRNAEEGFALYKELYEKGINLVFLNEPLINTDVYKTSVETLLKSFNLNTDNIQDKDASELISSIMQAIQKYQLIQSEKQFKEAFNQAQKELDDFRERVKQGIRERKAKGLKIGGAEHRTRKDKQDKLDKIYKMSRGFIGKFTDKEIISMLKISSVTLCKYKRELRESIEQGTYKVA